MLLALGLTFCTLTLAWLALYALAVHRLAAVLQRERVRRSIEAVMGAALLGLGVRIALEPR